MPRLSVREYEQVVASANGIVMSGVEPAVAKYSLTITGTSQMLQAFNPRTKFVRLNTDIPCSIDIGALPLAVVGEGSMPAGATEYFGVQQSQNHRVAVIAE